MHSVSITNVPRSYFKQSTLLEQIAKIYFHLKHLNVGLNEVIRIYHM